MYDIGQIVETDRTGGHLFMVVGGPDQSDQYTLEDEMGKRITSSSRYMMLSSKTFVKKAPPPPGSAEGTCDKCSQRTYVMSTQTGYGVKLYCQACRPDLFEAELVKQERAKQLEDAYKAFKSGAFVCPDCKGQTAEEVQEPSFGPTGRQGACLLVCYCETCNLQIHRMVDDRYVDRDGRQDWSDQW